MAKSSTYQAVIALGAQMDKTFSPTMRAAQKGVQDVSQGFQKAAKTIAVTGAAIGAGIAAVGAASIKLGTTVIKQFGELEQNLGGSEAVFGEYAAAIQKTGEEAYKNLGVSQSDYLATANKMGALFQGSGIDQAKSLELTEKSMQRAADMASVMGIDMQVALDSVAGAAKGNFTMMDNLGVAMNATNIEAYALAKGLNFTWKTATQAQKAEVAMQMFFDNTEQYAGNFARESTETITGSLGLLKAAMGSFTAGLGNSKADMANLTENLVDAFEAVVTNVVPVFKNIAAALPKAFTAILPAIGDLLPSLLGTVTELATQVLDMGLKLLPDLIPMAVQAIMTISQALIDNLPLLVSAAVELGKELVVGIASALPELIPALASAGMEALEGLSGIFSGIDGGLFESITALISDMGEQLFSLAQTVGPPIISVLKTIGSTVLPPLAKVIGTLVSTLLPPIIAIIQKLVPILAPIIEKLAVIIGKLGELISAILPPLITILSTSINAVIGFIEPFFPIIDNVITRLGYMIDFVTAIFNGDWKTAFECATNIFRSTFEGLVSIAKAPLNSVIGYINGLFSGLNKTKIPDWVPGVGGKGFSFPQIPMLYKGARNFAGGAALVGERGPELVNLPRGSNVFTNTETTSILSKVRDFGDAAFSIILNVHNIINGPITKEQAEEAAANMEKAVEAALKKIEAKHRRTAFAG